MCANRRSMRQWDAVSNASNLWASLPSRSLCLQCRLRRPKSPQTITMPWRLLTTLMAFDHHEPTHRRSCSHLSDSGAPPPNHPSTMQASSRRGGLNPSMRFSFNSHGQDRTGIQKWFVLESWQSDSDVIEHQEVVQARKHGMEMRSWARSPSS